MLGRRSFIVVSAGSVLTMLSALGVARRSAAAPPAIPPVTTALAPPAAREAAVWVPDFTGAEMSVGAVLDLRQFVAAPPGATLRFSINPASAPIAGILSLTSAGMLTRIGPGTIAGVLIDTDDGT